MVWTNAQTTLFFTEAAQMGIPAATRAQMQTEGLTMVNDLRDLTRKRFVRWLTISVVLVAVSLIQMQRKRQQEQRCFGCDVNKICAKIKNYDV